MNAILVFRVALRLCQDDEESRGIGRLLASLCSRNGLGGGGGYRNGRPTGRIEDDVVILSFQQNRDDGRLRSCTEEDREHVRLVLSEHPDVLRFIVGELEDGRWDSQAEFDEDEDEFVRRFLAS